MKFRGKGYYIYKTLRNTVAPNFGYAHRVYVYAYFVSLKFLSKTAIILFGLLKTDLFKAGQSFKKTRPINVFTGRGVRFNRQIVYRKTGKVSTYR
jgi:ribosomal protein L6P/L9E